MGKQEILILSATAVVWLVTIFGRPYIGLVYFYLYSELYYTNIFSEFRPLRIPFVTSVLVLVSMILNYKERIHIPRQTWLMLIFFFIMCLSRLSNNLEVFDHYYMDFFWKATFLQLLIVSLIDTRQKLKCFAWVLVIAGATLAYVARYHDTQAPYLWVNRNDFAGLLVSVVPFACFLAFTGAKKLLQLEGLGYFAILLFGVAGTNSRGGYLALAVVLALSALLTFRQERLRTLLLGALVVVAVLSRVSDVHWQRFSTVRLDLEQGGTGGQRLAAWGAGWNMLTANPLLGVGVGEFPNSFGKYATAEQKRRAGGDWFRQRINAHNTIVQIAAETGLLGLSVWLMLMAMSFQDLRRALRLARGDPELRELFLAITIGFIGYLVAGLFGNYGYYYELYTFVALSAVIRRIAEQERAAAMAAPEATCGSACYIGYPQWLQVGLRTLLFAVCTYIGLRL
ncbi:MAG: hypothetical protein KatS3mg131_3788 [Candidatus Tectimicrobiota bacterium]|nr:MAG: hypothetical protein KatS3mg131_3788 [Candidatus Tectomicrobia bacterium]